MKLSTKGRYGLKAMIDIAVFSEDGFIPLNVIAERQNIPVLYLEQLMPSLRRAGLVKSARGQFGGYKLNKNLDEINTSDIIIALEGSIAPVACVDETISEYERCGDECDICISKKVWGKMYEAVTMVLDNIKLSELADDYKKVNNIGMELI